MATHRSWVFETTAPLDVFRYWFLRFLRESGWTVAEASVHEHDLRGPAGRAYATLSYHEDGVRLDAKIRTGLIRGSASDVAAGLTAAGRRAQSRARTADPEADPDPLSQPNG